MTPRTMALWSAVVVLLSAAETFAARQVERDGSIPLPLQRRTAAMPDEARQAALSRSEPWRSFTSRNGSWSVLWNEATGTPHRAFGPAVSVGASRPAAAADAREASMSFIRENAGLLGVRPDQLRCVRSTLSRGIWYVSYVQTQGGRDVLLSEIEVRLSAAGKVMAFGSDFYADAAAPAAPSLSPAAAERAAIAGLATSGGRISATCSGELFVLPLTGDGATRYSLVYDVRVERASPPGNFVTYVDAMTGDVVWRFDRVRYGVRGSAEGAVQLLLPTDPFVTRSFSSQHIMLGGMQVTTDGSGRFTGSIGDSAVLTAGLSGSSVDVNRDDAPDAFFTRTIHDGDSLVVRWDETNAHPAERDGFFHANIIHDFITALDPQFTAISYSMPCAVNINQTCNAFWNGVGINFFREGGGCPNTAQMPDVLYHEYGHGINDKLYQQLGRSFGMINSAVHEGMADVAAAMVTDDSRIGRGFFGPGSILRSILNGNRYPRDISTDPHITGLILAGAFWDIRVATSLQTMRELSHFAKYGLPDDPSDVVAFSEWFLETLIADDDDGNLANGTPHSAAILQAFDAHGIGGALFFRQSFTHTPIASTDDTTQAYPAVFTLGGIPGVAPDSVRLFYSTDGFASLHAVDAQSVLPSTYQAMIPPQHGGTVVRYFISAADPVGGTTYTFPSGAPDSGSYRFMVGRQATEPGILYATASGTPNGRLYRLDPASGSATLVGSLGISSIYALAIHPVTKELFGFSGGPSITHVYKLSPAFGDAFELGEIPVSNLRAATFSGGDTLYLADAGNRLYRSFQGDTTLIGTAAGLFYASLAMHPADGTLWASVRPPVGFRDRIYQINRETGAPTLIGPTGDNLPTPAIAFGPGGTLFALKGLSTQINSLLHVSTTTGEGTVIGLTGVSGLQTLAMRFDSVSTSLALETAPLPSTYTLDQNYPNPFNGETILGYGIPESGSGAWVLLRVYDVLGREVATLVNERKAPGSYRVGFHAADLPSGVYFYRLQIRQTDQTVGGAATRTGKMMLLR